MFAIACQLMKRSFFLQDVSPKQADNNLDTPIGQALNAISYIGVIVSIISLLVTVVTYLASRYVHLQCMYNLDFLVTFAYILFPSIHQ